MKKLFGIIALVLFIGVTSFDASAQRTMTNSGDTVTNTGTVNLDLTSKNSFTVVGFQAVVSKLTGTVDGTGILQASLDGTNYLDISTDTLQLSDVATNTKLWTVSNSPYIYYRIKVTGSGTMTATATGYALERK